MSRGWIKPLTEWKSKSYNRTKQFTSLARHLWAQYDVPVFMDKAGLAEILFSKNGDSIDPLADL